MMSGEPELSTDAADMAPIYRKITLRVIPFLFLCYLFNYIDRVNVGFAKLQMLSDLGMSEAVYGLGAGIFFIGYLACGIPSNLMLQKVGARRWIALMMVTWGLFSTALMFVRTPGGFYALRFLTGAAEAGFFPGVVLYLTRWFPQARQGRVMTVFMSAIPVSGVLGGAISGWILSHFAAGQNNLAAWQWLFLIQGLPTILLGVVAWFVLSDGFESASWLPPDGKRALRDALAGDEATKSTGAATSFASVIRNPVIWIMGALYFCIQSGVYGINFWLPTIIANSGRSNPLIIGLLSAIPYLAAVFFMVAMGRSADRRRERRWHLALPLALSLVGLLIAAGAGDPGISLVGMTLATMGALTGLPLFWPLVNHHLSATAAPGGLALINSCGQIAGFVSPYLIGLVKDRTGSTGGALVALAVGMLIGALIVVFVPAKRTSR